MFSMTGTASYAGAIEMPQAVISPPEYVARYRSFIRDFPDYNIRPTQHAYQRMAEHAVTSQ